MMTIAALLIGLLIFGAGLYYFVQNKHDAESRKIYGITAAVGAVIAIIGAVLLLA